MRVKLWLGVGSWVMTSGLPTLPPDEAMGLPSWKPVPSAFAQSGGEGGEAGVSAETGSGHTLTVLESARGFAGVAAQMATSDDDGGANLQLDHAGAEVAEIEGALGAAKVEGISAEIERVRATLEAGAQATSAASADLDRMLVATAESQAPGWSREVPATLGVVLGLLQHSQEEYAESVADGRVVEGAEAEYLGGRGLFLLAREHLSQIRARLAEQDAAAAAAMDAEMAELGETLAASGVPKEAVPEAEDVAAAVSRMELATSRVRRDS